MHQIYFYTLNLLHRQTWNKPVQFCPSPVNPSLQEQLNPPSVLLQVALLWQLWEPLWHSLISKVKIKHVLEDSLNRRTGTKYILASLTLKMTKFGMTVTRILKANFIVYGTFFLKSSCLEIARICLGKEFNWQISPPKYSFGEHNCFNADLLVQRSKFLLKNEVRQVWAKWKLTWAQGYASAFTFFTVLTLEPRST